ncbi:hypothetical protein N9040_06550 [Akkermansiaceae bacterium]|nr:hypothetical protein [Akkermansiaceae bacterium]MDB4714216.1 hypothetical protein [Akkermansiaceae bacterium]MDB4719702.1 hypothetical protein [Akkermansiaceae bacterium]MDB4748329.1 hypothetical protein [Akkermansiaceae bacterium]MDC0318401.1 hypothetical protein [Akkermansiaceae bacterium]
MKFTPFFLWMILAGGVAFAAPPTSPHRLDRYKDLYLNSALTDPPEVITNDPEPENLPDWILVAVSKYVGKTEVEVMNIKDRTRIRIPSPEATEMGFAIKEVKQFRNFIEETVVTLKKGKETGEVRFDPKFLVLKKVAGPTTNKAKPQANSKTPPSKTNRPPIPGKPSTSSSSKSDKRGRPSTGSRVPLPSTSSSSTKSSGSTSKPRVRYVPKK